MTESLLAFDTDRIKSYVFATGKLKEIRGASAILDELNREQMVKEIERLGGRCIYANGGSGLFIIDSNQAQTALAVVEKLYREKTSTASISGTFVDLPPDYKSGDNIQLEFRTLGYRLRAAKDGKAGLAAPVTHPYLHFCDSCGVGYAEKEYSKSGETALLCTSCDTKRRKDEDIKEAIHRITQGVISRRGIQETGLWANLIPTLDQKKYEINGYDRPDDFEELASLSSPNNYIGLIYADGDTMGKALEQLETEDNFKEFSEAVDHSIYLAVVEAIEKHLTPSGKKIWPFDILLLGGDDLVMVTPAHKVLEVGLTVMEKFTELTRKDLDRGEGLRLSVGIAIAHTNYPFGQLLRLAESALKFAKKEGVKRRQAGQSWEGGLLNFVVVSSTNHLEFEDYFKEQLNDTAEEVLSQDKNLYRTLRPYNADDFQKLLKHIRQLKSLRAPRSKLEQLRTLIFQTRRMAMVDGLALLFHWRSEKQREAIQSVVYDFTPQPPEHGLLFPWFQVGPKGEQAKFLTPLLDLIEIFDFIPEGGS
ncbi:MAG: hypothetical protein KJ077_22265 [Anaerolineae bacterium]|nr:hypothetical protein [Anaerolineae bacterium]